jgi:heme/copper-type cytochrome/quinol oxidase subunit 2
MLKTLISAAKAMVSVVALVLAFTVNASAQDKAANGAQKMTDNMKTELKLTDVQYGKVLEINKNFTDKASEARKSTTDKKAAKAAIKGFNEERETKLKAVLTEEQFKAYLAKKEEKMNAAKNRIDKQQTFEK